MASPVQHQHLVVTISFSSHEEMEAFKAHIVAMAGVTGWHELMSDSGRRDRTISEFIRASLPQG
jgi:hypothetical protein